MIKFSDLNDNDNIMVVYKGYSEEVLTKKEILKNNYHKDRNLKFYTTAKAKFTIDLKDTLFGTIADELYNLEVFEDEETMALKVIRCLQNKKSIWENFKNGLDEILSQFVYDERIEQIDIYN